MPGRKNEELHQWTREELIFLRTEASRESAEFIAHKLNLAIAQVKKKCKELKLIISVKGKWGKRVFDFLKANYKTLSNAEMADKLNEMFPYVEVKFSRMSVSCYMTRLGLQRTENEKRIMWDKITATGCYKETWNTKGIGHISWRKSMARKNKDITADCYYIKTKNGWESYKKWLYEQHFGLVPKGRQVTLIDGNERNVVIENLLLVDKTNSANKATVDLTDNYILSVLLFNEPNKEDTKKRILANPKYAKTLIELERIKIISNRKVDGKKDKKLERPSENDEGSLL